MGNSFTPPTISSSLVPLYIRLSHVPSYLVCSTICGQLSSSNIRAIYWDTDIQMIFNHFYNFKINVAPCIYCRCFCRNEGPETFFLTRFFFFLLHLFVLDSQPSYVAATHKSCFDKNCAKNSHRGNNNNKKIPCALAGWPDLSLPP